MTKQTVKVFFRDAANRSRMGTLTVTQKGALYQASFNAKDKGPVAGSVHAAVEGYTLINARGLGVDSIEVL